jgi:hypothetical protein
MGMKDWHGTTHGNPNGPAGETVIKMQAYLAGELVYFVERLQSLGAGPGSLLASGVVVFGTQNGNTNQTNFAKEDHDRHNTPLVLVGGCGGKLATGRIVDCGGANHNDVYCALGRAFGLDVTSVGDPTWCKGPLPGLA